DWVFFFSVQDSPAKPQPSPQPRASKIALGLVRKIAHAKLGAEFIFYLIQLTLMEGFITIWKGSLFDVDIIDQNSFGHTICFHTN
ncbi:hypothetical protein ACJX0J_030623, partial [Zea mays]